MRAILGACAISLAIYLAAVFVLLDRPLTNGMLLAEVEAKLARAASLRGPKLVILAGSNGPYSHRCEVMEPILGRPCVNGGVAVGIGLDYLFARWDGLLRPGDVVYLPMEPSQYTRPRLATATGPDAAIMARRDRGTLASLSPVRWLGAAFAYDLRGMVMAMLEMALHGAGFRDPRPQDATNAWGDHTGHDGVRARANAGALAAMRPVTPEAEAIAAGDGRALIANFTRRMVARGVAVIGGLSTGFADAPLSDAAVGAIADTYTSSGGAFLSLPNRSRYPRAAFYDGPEHLREAAQIAHSRAVAQAMRPLLGAAQ